MFITSQTYHSHVRVFSFKFNLFYARSVFQDWCADCNTIDGKYHNFIELFYFCKLKISRNKFI